jgi:zinc protease
MFWPPVAGRALLALGLPLCASPAWAVTVEKVVSPGGIEAWLVEDHTNPIIAMEVSFRGGSVLDPEAKPGVAAMTAGLLDEGAGPYDSKAFQEKLEDLALTLNFDAGRDSLRGHLKTLTPNRDTAFDLFRLALTQPRFAKEPVERIRNQMLTGLMREAQDPNAQAQRRWFETMFAGHPYARSSNGTLASVKTIQVGDIRAYARRQLTRDRLIIGVVGDITPAELSRLLDSTFPGLPVGGDNAALAPALTEASPRPTGGLSVIDKDNPQAVAVFGAPGIKRDDPDWYAAYLMNYILGGGGFSSRLTEEVREKRGLAYSVYSYLAPMKQAGILIGGVATENGRIAESLGLIKGEFRRMRDLGPRDEELANAKTYVNGSFPLQLDSTTAIAGLLVQLQSDGLGADFLDRRAALIEAVGVEDIKRVALRLLDPDALTIVVVGRPTGL